MNKLGENRLNKTKGIKIIDSVLQSETFGAGQKRRVPADIFCSGHCGAGVAACAQTVFPFLQSPIIPTARAGF